MPEETIRIRGVFTGKPEPIGPDGTPSAIDKDARDGPVRLTRHGFEGDQQGDQENHGGVEKAVHHYPFDHYEKWREELPGSPEAFDKDAPFGENISTAGWTEKNVHLRDIFQMGEACVQVTQLRQPCWKLNVRFDVKEMARRVQKTGRTGWYYRVLEPGDVSPGDRMRLIERKEPDWSLDRVRRILYVDALNIDALDSLMQVPGLPKSWKRRIGRRLSTSRVEDWSERLQGPAGDQS